MHMHKTKYDKDVFRIADHAEWIWPDEVIYDHVWVYYAFARMVWG